MAAVAIGAEVGIGAAIGVGVADGVDAAIGIEECGSISMVGREISDFTFIKYVWDVVRLCEIVLTSAVSFYKKVLLPGIITTRKAQASVRYLTSLDTRWEMLSENEL